MQSVTLYGKGAVLIHDDRNTYRSENGQISVPEKFVAGLIAQGWTRQKPAEELPDRTAEIQRLVDDAAAANGVVTLPVGELKTESPIQIPEGLAKIESTEDAAIEGADAIQSLDSGAPEVIDVSGEGIAQNMTKAFREESRPNTGDDVATMQQATHESPEAFKLQEYRDALAAGFSEDEAKALVWPAGDAPAELPTLEG